MDANLYKTSWADLYVGELRCILQERIGGPGQYRDRSKNPRTFYLPLADSSCEIIVTFSEDKQILRIELGPAFDVTKWEQVVNDIESPGPIKVGRDCSFSSFRVVGSWRGMRSGVQILPPPADAPRAPYEMAEHPFVLEYPLKTSDLWPITNYRRIREHLRLTLLLNILIAGRTCVQPRRSRHLWATVPGNGEHSLEIKWVQEFFLADFGEAVVDHLLRADGERIKEIEPGAYYTSVCHDGRTLQVPADLDDLICCYTQLSAKTRASFDRASFWMDMASRQWTMSFSAVFASLAIAVEALGDRALKATERFRKFIEQYAPGGGLESRRKEMYALRSDILHGSALMEMDQEGDFGWAPPEQNEKDLMDELWGLTGIAVRNWLKAPPT